MRVLVTRPVEDSGRTAEALRAAGHEAVLAPLFVVAPLEHAVPQDGDAVVATSANALRHARLERFPRDRPLYAVGRATADEARRAGFQDLRIADGDSRDLAALIAAGAGRRLIYLAGRPRRDAALKALCDRFDIAVVETYETRVADALSENASEALRSRTIDAVLHFSPRAAEAFHLLAERAGLFAEAEQALHVFISPAAVMDVFPRRRIADRPNLAAMIEALGAPA